MTKGAAGGTLPSQSILHSREPAIARLGEWLDAALPPLMRERCTPGLNVAIGRGGRIGWEGAYGYADVAAKKAARVDSVFRSGSIGKTYAVTAIMQLLERRRLTLEDPINEHLPFRVGNPLGGPEVSILHLLTHTSGLGGDAAGSVLAGHSRPLAEALERAIGQELQPVIGGVPTWTKPAGELRQYSNLGIALLGLIVERANGKALAFGEYVERHIMAPLQMRFAQYPPAQTDAWIRPELQQRASTGYHPMGGVLIPTADVCIESYPAGGFVATAGDQLRLLLAMLQGGQLDQARILESATVDRILTPALSGTINQYGVDLPREQQGLVWWLRDWNQPHRAFHHHGGHMYGWRTVTIAWPGSGTAAVLASNRWSSLHGAGELIENQFEELIEYWLRSERRPATVPLAIDRLPWKASYLRGLLFVESYNFTIGVPQRIGASEAQHLANAARPCAAPEAWTGWDANGFVAGVSDMSAVPASSAAIRDFVVAGPMKITLEEARAIYSLLDPVSGSMASLAGLLSH